MIQFKMKNSIFALLFVSAFFLASCSGNDGFRNREKGVLAGTAIGAGLGAIIGSATGDAGVGTAIGGGIGALTGGVVGNNMDREEDRQRAYDSRLDANESRLRENQRIINELKNQGADARVTDRGIVVNLPDVLFEFNRANLTPGASATVGQIADTLRGVSGRHISVEGHTDSVGTMSYNQSLSEQRARNVAREIERNGISRARISTRGFGESDPIATNANESGRARNRRVEVIVENNW